MSTMLSRRTIETGSNPHHSIIWLHGLGADGSDFAPVADELKLPVAVRYVFPDAPMRPVTVNGGMVMRAWYDIASPSIDTRQDAAGIRAAQSLVEELIDREAEQGIARNRIFLAGFSQGGAVALHTALRQPVPLGGVLALSTYLPLADSTAGEALAVTRDTPIFMAHGRADPVIPCALGKVSVDTLLGLGYTVEWHEYAMQHAVCGEELGDIAMWLSRQTGQNAMTGRSADRGGRK
ncbi:MAG TPA: alpha/beta fold hydrolase [Gallionella sp.]|nr:alpha/beta fold hydrolase [Gallionella sp.]